VEALAERYEIALPYAIQSPRAGERAGRRAGSSVEFQDRKDFSPGDDLRHVDWRGFARSDRMTVKLYREEIMPRIDIVVDGSASMEVTSAKRLRRLELAYLFWMMGRHLHGQVGCWWAAGGAPQMVQHPMELNALESVRSENPLPGLKGSALSRPGGIRIFISDLLYPFDPALLETTLGACDRLMVVQVLSSFEASPGEGLTSGSMMRLMNAEADEYLDVRLDEATVAQYKKRLTGLQNDLAQRLQRRGGALAVTRDDEGLDALVRNLHAAGMVTL